MATLRTRRCLLRPFTPADEPAFLAYQADPDFARFHGPGEVGPEAARSLLRIFRDWDDERPRRRHAFAVLDEAAGALIGTACLREEDGCPPGEAEFGIELDRRCWGRHGLALEISRAVLRFGFEELGYAALRATTVDGNRVAGRLAVHLGFQPVEPPPAPVWMQERGWRQEAWRLSREAWRGASPCRRGPSRARHGAPAR